MSWLRLYGLGFCAILLVSARPQSDVEEKHPADDIKCPENRVAYFVTPRVSPLASYSFRADEVDIDTCREWCSKNQSPKEEPADCASFTYNDETRQCKLYGEKTFPDGVAERRTTKKPKRMFEKYCMPEKVAEKCAKTEFRRVDEKILKGFAEATAMVKTLGDCMTECIQQGEFVCKSAMFFYDEGECITNLETDDVASTDGLIDPEDDDRAIFIQNDCYLNAHPKKEKENDKVQIDADVTVEPPTKATEASVVEKSSTEAPAEVTVHEEIAEAPKEIQFKESTTERLETVELHPESQTEQKSQPEPAVETPKPEEPKAETASERDQFASTIIEQNIPDAVKQEKRPELYGAKILKLEDARGRSILAAEEVKEEKPAKIGAPDSTKKLKISSLHTEVFHAQAQPEAQPDRPAPPTPLPSIFGAEQLLFSQWGAWTPCTMRGEKRVRRRKCLDLKKCRGQLMQIENCPAELIPDQPLDITNDDAFSSGPVGPARQPLPVELHEESGGAPPAILPPKLPTSEREVLPEGAPGSADDIWSPWLGVCQRFQTKQPCRNGQVIGFESRECIARDPKSCQGPFFRYCTLPC